MNRIALVVALLAGGIAAPLAAAPLCHDLKGLFTPCPPGAAGHAARARAATVTPVASERAERAEQPARPERPPAIARAKLCHDLKGLFTPCPR